MTDPRLLLEPTTDMLEGWVGPATSEQAGDLIFLGQPVEEFGQIPVLWKSDNAVRKVQHHRVRLDLSRWECRALVLRWISLRSRSPTSVVSWGAPYWPALVPYIPTLADLDPYDDTLLPDGSRFVDAFALATVARWEMERRR